MDPTQPVQAPVGLMESPHLWMVGLATVDDGPFAESGDRPYSFRAECECPDDCFRDHDNE